MADNDAAVEAAIRERQADGYEEASKGIALAAPLLMLKDVRTLLTLRDSLRAERDSLQARLTKLESRWDANVAETRAYMENDVALCNERDSLRKALGEIVERYHADTCAHALVADFACNCHVFIARAALAAVTTQEVGDGK